MNQKPDQYNPYQPPSSDDTSGGETAAASLKYWIGDKNLVIPLGQSELPHRCVYCNAPVTEPIKERKLYWHHPGWYLLLFVSIWIYIIVALIVRKKIMIKPGLCEAHLQTRRKGIIMGWVFFFIGLACVPIDIFFDLESLLTIFGVITILISIFVIMYSSRILSIHKIDKDKVYLSKCSQVFLDSFKIRTDEVSKPVILNMNENNS